MPLNLTNQQITDIMAVLSPQQFDTYLTAARGDKQEAMELYCWNTDIAATFFVMLKFCELSIRSGTAEAVENAFGPNWHREVGFARTLPSMGKGYRPSEDLKRCVGKCKSANKIVVELNFIFWESLFTKRQQARLWKPHLARAFPRYDKSLTVERAHEKLFSDIRKVRRLRNRIAHHKPVIFGNDLREDRDRIMRIVEWRRPGVAKLLIEVENIDRLLSLRPRHPWRQSSKSSAATQTNAAAPRQSKPKSSIPGENAR